MLEFNVRDPKIVPLDPELQDQQNRELNLQREWMKNPNAHFVNANVAEGPPRIRSAGVELELLVVDEESGNLGDAGFVLDAFPAPDTATEFLRAAVEWISPGMEITPNFLTRLADFHFDSWKRTQAVLDQHESNSYPLGIGYYPDGAMNFEEQRRLMCTRKPRYAQIEECLVVRNGAGHLCMTNLEGKDIYVLTNGGPYVPGLASSEHMNFVTNRPGLTANAAIIAAAVIVSLSATSPFVRSIGNDVFGGDCSRWFLWHLMGNSPFAMGHYYMSHDVQASVEWSRFLVSRAEVILPFEASVYPGHPLPVTHHQCGTTWIKTDRLRHGWDAEEGRIMLRNENRISDIQLTAHDSVALFAFVMGLTQSLMKLLEYVRPEDCMPYAIAERSACAVAQWGHASTSWMGKRMSVAELGCEVFLPMAMDGLDSLGICSKDSIHFLSSIERRFAEGNGSSYLRRSFKKIEESRSWATRGEVVMEVLRRLAKRQSYQEHPLCENGFCDWELL